VGEVAIGEVLGTYVSGLVMLEIADGEFTIEIVVVFLGQTVVPGQRAGIFTVVIVIVS